MVGTRAWRRVATGGIAERLACFSGTLMTYEFKVGASTMVQFIVKEKGVRCGGGDGAESCEELCHCFSRFGDFARVISDRRADWTGRFESGGNKPPLGRF